MNDELTTRLSRQLHEQADTWQDAPLTLDGVRGRARSIRRTRRIAAGVAVAAVFAISAPVAILATGGLDAAPDRQVPPATSTPDGSESPSEAVEQQPSPLGVPYLEGRTLTMPDGSEVELPRKYDGVTVRGGEVLATWIDTDDGSVTLDRLQDGEVIGSEPISGIAANHEGDAVAYVPSDGQIIVEWAGGDVTLDTVPGARPIRLVGGADCSSGDCVVYYEDGQTVRWVDGSGDSGTVDGITVTDVSVDGSQAVRTSVDDLEPGSCSEVRGGSDVAFSTCDFSLGRFSPDGSHLSANEAYLDGIGSGFVAILDARTGEELNRLEPAEGFVNTVTWEDADRLLAIVHDWSDGTWRVERISADGSTETVLGPVEGGEMNPPWRLGDVR